MNSFQFAIIMLFEYRRFESCFGARPVARPSRRLSRRRRPSSVRPSRRVPSQAAS